MKTSRLLIGALVSFVALVLFATSAHADTISVDPASGPVGTTFTVSGDGCTAPPVTNIPVVIVDIMDGDEVVVEGGAFTPNPDGTWSADVIVDVAGNFSVVAFCGDNTGTGLVPVFFYEELDIIVTEVIVTTTTTEPTTTTTEPEPTTTTTEPEPTTTTTEEPPPLPLMCPDGYEVEGDRCVAVGGNTFQPPPGGQVITDDGLAEDDYYEQNTPLVMAIILAAFAGMLFLTRDKRAKRQNTIDVNDVE